MRQGIVDTVHPWRAGVAAPNMFRVGVGHSLDTTAALVWLFALLVCLLPHWSPGPDNDRHQP